MLWPTVYSYVAALLTISSPVSTIGATGARGTRPYITSTPSRRSVKEGFLRVDYTVSRGGSSIFEKGVHLILMSTSKKGGGPGGGPTLCPMLKSLQRRAKKGGGGVRTRWTPMIRNKDLGEVLEVKKPFENLWFWEKMLIFHINCFTIQFHLKVA